jgi:DNA-directed RNA polymerase specialized sigma subunit
MTDLTDQNVVNKLTRTAHAVAKGYGLLDHVDDFKQFMFEKYLGGRKGKVSQIFIDYIRYEFGDSRHENETFRFNKAVEWEESMDTEVFDQHEVDLNRILNSFKGEERTMMTLYHKWGFTYKEIGETLGYSEAKVFLIMKDLNRKVRKVFGNA